MSLVSKRPAKLLAVVLMVALTPAAALLAWSAPTFADPPCDSDQTTPDCLAITSVSPEPGATNVSVAPTSSFTFADFNQNITADKLGKTIRLKNLDLAKGGVNVTETVSYFIPEYVLRVIPNTYDGNSNVVFECDTAYKVRVGGGPGSGQVRSESGQEISEVPAGVSLKDGVARWTFTTAACP